MSAQHNRKAMVDDSMMVRDDVAYVPPRKAPGDAARHLHAVEGVRETRALDANTDVQRYICVGFAVIRI
jgi:hypothetical protein